jgi:hypothetical protein
MRGPLNSIESKKISTLKQAFLELLGVFQRLHFISGNFLKYFGVDFTAILSDRESSKEVRNLSRIGQSN